MESYKTYKADILERLVAAAGKTWNDGVWAPTGNSVEHILPLIGENTKANRAKAIEKYLHFDCKRCLPENLKGLHQYAHHLNSSQLLCMMFFSQMLDNERKATEQMVKFVNDTFHISIKVGAECSFEYTEKCEPYIFNVLGKKEYEGTSFDFHIKDGDTEIFFEIKLTEQGFGKADDNSRHQAKAKQYVKLLPTSYKNVTPDMLLDNYQIFRNVIRARNIIAHVIFITDSDNPITRNDAENFEERFGKQPNVHFVTWQEIAPEYPFELPFQLKAMTHTNSAGE